MQFFTQNFGFRAPYQVLVDGTFCQAALKCQILIKEQIPNYLGSEVQLCEYRSPIYVYEDFDYFCLAILIFIYSYYTLRLYGVGKTG